MESADLPFSALIHSRPFIGSKVRFFDQSEFSIFNHISDGNKISKNESILKFEQINAGCERVLIAKNCTKDDFAEYTVQYEPLNHPDVTTEATLKPDGQAFANVNQKQYSLGRNVRAEQQKVR